MFAKLTIIDDDKQDCNKPNQIGRRMTRKKIKECLLKEDCNFDVKVSSLEAARACIELNLSVTMK